MDWLDYTNLKMEESQMKFYSVKETSEILKLDEITLYEKIKSGDLKAFRTGKKYLISEEQIKEFLNNS